MSNVPDVSLLAPVTPLRSEHLLPWAAMVQWTGAVRLWQGQTMAVDPHQMFSAVAAAGFRVPCATGVTLMPSRHPVEAALQARTVALTTGHPFIAGFGPGAEIYQEALLGRRYARPLAAVRDYVTAVRSLLSDLPTDETTDVVGADLHCRTSLAPVPGPPVQIGLGVLRPRMAELAGEVADVVVTWLTPAAYLRDVVVPAVRAGARAAGRPVPRVVAMVPTALAGPGRDLDRIALASNAAHLMLPHYRSMLATAGIDVPSGDLEKGARLLVEGRAFLGGTVSELVDGLAEFRAAGVDEVVLNFAGVAQSHGAGDALRDAGAVVEAVTA